jgi:hypothetical protein
MEALSAEDTDCRAGKWKGIWSFLLESCLLLVSVRINYLGMEIRFIAAVEYSLKSFQYSLTLPFSQQDPLLKKFEIQLHRAPSENSEIPDTFRQTPPQGSNFQLCGFPFLRMVATS